MTYEISGANKETGDEVKIKITALSSEDATRQASEQGILVASIRKLSIMDKILSPIDEIDENERQKGEQERKKNAQVNPIAYKLRFWGDIISFLSLGLLRPTGVIFLGLAELIDQQEKLIKLHQERN